ncbi:ABC transporter substrate-binding protein [Candidatus Sumerlaeota bacterium]|nr:ABC transporter substrate-binding protein [Candidatus Sumerlaeota bacterium]
MLVFMALIAALCTSSSQAQGVSDTEILVGQSCALDGPASALGTGMKAGLEASFAEVNKHGGVHGRMIKLISYDDGYEPDKAIENTKRLVEEDNIFALIGEVGTPTSKAVVPIAEKAGCPFFGPFTGAEFLRNPFNKYVVNLRGSYYQEMEALAACLVDRKELKKIACFYQNDGYGQAGLSGIELALEKRSMKLCATSTYERNTLAVKSGLLEIRKAQPDAVVMVGAYAPCAEFIKQAKKVGMKDVIFCNISFVGTEALKDALGEAGEGCIISQVVPFPWDDSIPLVKEYQAALAASPSEAKPGFVSLEGYMVGKFFADVAEAAGQELNREGFLNAVSSKGNYDLGGVTLKFGPSDHQGMDEIYLTQITGGEIKQLEE